MHRPEGGFQHPLQLPRAVTSAAQKSSAAPDPTTAGNRRTTFEVPTNRHLSCVGERAGCRGRWRAVLHLAVGQIAKSTALSYTCTTSTRRQHTHAHQPLATRGVRKPYRTTAGLA